ncbi:uncharacterized protein LOC132785918 [Drosophila nasuta]|uniref:uncharacterized protein LOC132785918 n=1 Tax=Drosophila nasuta TaxID=42062 RepID=UPI00295E3965|nr:uncharacterized protein LOC132785918 [Drosophila nasuta]
MPSGSANAYTLPLKLDTLDDIGLIVETDAVAIDNGDEILRNIIKSNERLSQELAKMPPLPKLSSYKKYKAFNNVSISKMEERATATATPTATATTTATAMANKSKCFCPSFMRSKHDHEDMYGMPAMQHRNSSEMIALCSGNSKINSSSSSNIHSGNSTRAQSSHSKSKHCHVHVPTTDTHHKHQMQHQQYRTAPATGANASTTCCHSYKTELLPCMQQHLVLNQTISSGNICQSPCQTSHLTVDADTAAPATTTTTATTSAPCKGRSSNALSASIKPKHYFEQLLQRDGCNKKPRPPVKVDVNVRLVPKQSKPRACALNETFVKELDEVAHALNETFVNDSSPELAEINESLAQFEVVGDDDQEQITKL